MVYAPLEVGDRPCVMMEAAGPHDHSMALVGRHMVLIAAVSDDAPHSYRWADCDDTMALMALMADALGGRATRRDDELPLHSPPRQKRGERTINLSI